MLNYNLYFSSILIFCALKIVAANEHCEKNKELSAQLKIKEHIFCDYDKTVRPVINNNATALDIKFLVHHFDFEEPNTLAVDAWFGMKWSDEHIHWDPDKFDDVETIILTSDNVWTPDLSIHNRGSYSNSKIIKKDAECLITYYKRVICIAQTRIRGMCIPDFRHYPYDVQNCTLIIGSWFHRGDEIDLVDTEVIADIGSYYTQHALNPEWHLESLTFHKNPGLYEIENYPNATHPTLEFTFLIRRNASARFAVIIMPVLVLIGMSLVTLWLDPTSSDRILILTINIPAHISLLLNMQWDLPTSGESVPYLIQLMRNSQLIVLYTLIETVVVSHFLKKTKESPKYLVNIFTIFASNKVGQLLLFSELNPENAAENLTADDVSNLVEITTERPKEWYLLGRVIDRLSFLLSILVYFVMFILCIPKKL